ncbi:hypothetical protein VTN96DRAFT_9592 [Rasamsonia emersonii]
MADLREPRLSNRHSHTPAELCSMEKAWEPHLALELPEILLEIFGYLESDRPSLAAAIRVNRKWFLHGTTILWRQASPRELARAAENRRQFYASKIRSLVFDESKASYDPYDLIEDLEVTNLKSVTIWGFRTANILRLKQYLQPSLEEFLFYEGDIDSSLLDHLKTTCRRLRKIVIDSPEPHITPSEFSEFLQGCASLESMKFMFDMDRLITDETLLHLAGHENLKVLDVGVRIYKATIEEILTKVPTPFKALQKLKIVTHAEAVPSLTKMVNPIRLRRLDLKLGLYRLGVLEQLSHLTDLRHLRLSFYGRLPSNELLLLRSLVKLEQLSISIFDIFWHWQEDGYLDLTDDEFEELISHLGHLRTLRIAAKSPLSAAILESLCKHCPFLQHCSIGSVFDMKIIQHRCFLVSEY